LGRAIIDRFGAAFPYATFAINVTGSFLIGIIFTTILERAAIDPFWRLLLVVGFLGGYTTFSSYSFEAVALLEREEWVRAGVYVIGSNALGLIACYAGMRIARVSFA
jgi:CrcB protein